MTITPLMLKPFGYTTKNFEAKMPVYFAHDRESYIIIDGVNIKFYKFYDDRPKEMFEGEVKDMEDLTSIINQFK